MVTIQDIGLQLTKPVKELAKWNFPLSQTLEKYYSIFNTTCSKSFGEAGLVLQNSAAVYVHRVDSLWGITDNSKNVLLDHENEDAAQDSPKRRSRKTDTRLQDFKTVNFSKEVDKNINIKKNVTHVKSKNRCFTQLEKGIAQHVSIDIYDINGEVIGKKYDFHCNQNISIDGVLVDALVEFAPQDFCCDSNNSTFLSAADCTLHDDNNQNDNSDTESERNNDSQEEEVSGLVTSLESTQQNLSFESTNTNNNTLHDITNETNTNTLSDTNLLMTDINDTILSNNNNDLGDYLNHIKNIDASSVLDSPPESVNSKDRRASSTDDLGLINDTNGDIIITNNVQDTCSALHLATSIIQNTPSASSTKSKIKTPKSTKSTLKSLKGKLNRIKKDETLTPSKRGLGIKKKNLTHIMDESNTSRKDKQPNMFNKSLRTCMKYIREYNPLQYNDVTNVDMGLLGFELCVVEANTNNENNDITDDTSINEISEIRSPSPDMSAPHENFCDMWLQSESSNFLPKNVEKWHEMIQPKLRKAEERSTFCIRDYASQIMETLEVNEERKTNFDAVIPNDKSGHEVARYFLALLDLAAKQKVDINAGKDLEHDIEIVLCQEDRPCFTNNQVDSFD